MAQNQFINITFGANAANIPGDRNQGHQGSQSAASANDLTISWDSAKFTTFGLLQAGVMAALKIAAGNFK